MRTLVDRTYYSMWQIANNSWDVEDASPLQAARINLTWSKVLTFDNESEGWPADIKALIDGTECSKLLQSYIWPKYANLAIAFVDREVGPGGEIEDLPSINTASQTICGSILTWLLETQEKYVYLIKLWDDVKADLMKQLTSKSTTLFNDTPQAGGDFTADNHVTNATQVSTSQDVDTPMARFKEIQNNIATLYERWANDFGRTFIMYNAK